jgi:pimeloyl-ACP methyl ester carboxylesterase
VSRGLVALAVLAACGGPPRPAVPSGSPLALGDHVAVLDGAELSYHVAGSGPPCLAVPGGPGIDSAYLRSPAERHLTMVYVDPAGTGGSARLADASGYTRARQVADLERLRAHLGLERPCLLGHSHGGMVVLLYALAHPDRVGRLILYATTARVDADWQRAARERLAARRGAPWFADVTAAFADRAAVRTDEEATRAVLRTAPAYFFEWREQHRAALGRSRAHAAPLLAADPGPSDLRPELGKIAAPALILAGRHDFVCAPPFSEELAAGIRGSRLTVFERSGHFAHLEEPEAFARAIAGFLE